MNERRVKLPLETHSELIDKAIERRRKSNERLSDAAIKIADEKVQYFEKIALGVGATIAAVVSFVGSNPNFARMPNLLRWSLLLLSLALATAMYRNWRYPFYILASRARYKVEAEQSVELLNDAMHHDHPDVPTIDENNEAVSSEQYIELSRDTAQKRTTQIRNAKQYEDRLFLEVRIVETACLIFVITAAALLTTLIWVNVGAKHQPVPTNHGLFHRL